MNNQFDRTIINTRERPLSSDINTLQSQIDRSIREVLKSFFTGRVGSGVSDLSGNPPSGFFGDGFKVRASAVPGLSVVLSKGQGFQYLPSDVPAAISSISGLDDRSEYKPLSLLADATLSGISAGDATNPRIDIIEVRMNRVVGNPLSRDVLDAGTGTFVATSVNKTLAFTQDGSSGVVSSPSNSVMALSYKQGVPAAVPAEPAVTAGYVKIASVRVAAAATTITKANISDLRVPLCQDGLQRVAVRGTISSTAGTPPSAVLQDLPAGMQALVHKTIDGDNTQFTVWFIGGATPIRGHASGSVLTAVAGPPFENLSVVDMVVGVVDAGIQALLAGAGQTSDAETFAIGTPYLMVACQAWSQNAGVTGNPSNPFVFDLHGIIKRY
jgi:hypothetical protein